MTNPRNSTNQLEHILTGMGAMASGVMSYGFGCAAFNILENGKLDEQMEGYAAVGITVIYAITAGALLYSYAKNALASTNVKKQDNAVKD